MLIRQQFMMDFELKMSKPSRKYACLEGLVMGLSYFVGKFLPPPLLRVGSTQLTHAH